MANVFDYIFNIGGNYSATINGMSAATGEFLAKVNGAQSCIGKLTTMLAAVDLVKNAIDGLSQATESLSVSGVQLNSQMHDLSAVAGVTGETLKQIAINQPHKGNEGCCTSRIFLRKRPCFLTKSLHNHLELR